MDKKFGSFGQPWARAFQECLVRHLLSCSALFGAVKVWQFRAALGKSFPGMSGSSPFELFRTFWISSSLVVSGSPGQELSRDVWFVAFRVVLHFLEQF
jgi:hypothetical protein